MFVIPWLVNVVYPDLFLWSAMLLLISWLSSVMSGWLGLESRRSFLFCILVRMCCGIGLLRLFMLPRGIYSLSACIIVSVINLVSRWILSEGV